MPGAGSSLQVANAIAQAREAAAWLGDAGEGHDGWCCPAEAPLEDEDEDEEEGSAATLLFESLRDWEKELKRLGAVGWRVSAVNERFDMAPRYGPWAPQHPILGGKGGGGAQHEPPRPRGEQGGWCRDGGEEPPLCLGKHPVSHSKWHPGIWGVLGRGHLPHAPPPPAHSLPQYLWVPSGLLDHDLKRTFAHFEEHRVPVSALGECWGGGKGIGDGGVMCVGVSPCLARSACAGTTQAAETC